MLLLAVPGALGSDLVRAAQWVGLLCSLGVIMVVLRTFAPFPTLRAAIPASVALLAFVVSPTVANWTVAGLEQPLLALLLAYACSQTIRVLSASAAPRRAAVHAGVGFGALALTRPDAALFGGVTALFLTLLGTADEMWGNRRSHQDAAKQGSEVPSRSSGRQLRQAGVIIGGLLALAYGGQLIVRYCYYGELVPNTALIKLSVNRRFLELGTRYVVLGGARFAVPVAVSLLAIVVCLRPSLRLSAERSSVLYLSTVGLAWTGYLFVMGGDVNWLWRHFIPLTVIWLFLTAIFLRVVIEGGSSRDRRELFLVLPFALLLHCVLQWSDIEAQMARRGRPEQVPEQFRWVLAAEPSAVVGTFFRTVFHERQPLVAVDSAGAVPFYSGLPAIDMLGLNDAYIARHPSSAPGSGWIGHDVGNGPYVLQRRPDIILFCSHVGRREPCYPGGRELVALPEFPARYRPAEILLAELPFPLVMWLRTESDRIGIRTTADEMIIPAYFLAGRTALRARAAEGEVLIELLPGQAAILEGFPLPAGEWRADALPEHVTAEVTRVAPLPFPSEAEGAGTLTVINQGPSPVELSAIHLRHRHIADGE